MERELKLISGSSNWALAEEIARYLNKSLAEVELKKFKDGEISVKIRENVREVDLFIIQSTCNPVNDHLMELLLLIDAAMRASARRVTAVIPYFGYARQDRKVEPRVPISAKVVADLLQAVGVKRILTMELHAEQIQGFFNIPVDNLISVPPVVEHISRLNISDMVVVSPDSGGVERARFLAKKINAGLAIIDKRRPEANVCQIMHVIGDVRGKNCILVDDMVDTAGSISGAADALRENGAKDIYCVATHPVLSGEAAIKLKNADFREIVTTNTIPIPESKKLKNLKIISMAPLLGEAIRRIHYGESVSSLFV
ncbi:MAG TPA: ribose-phosphate pyrophosphokinase [Spirochaetes bacterium]|nr:ribose-phosphate pyrophosphokinase [Spirochaetota bacterium]